MNDDSNIYDIVTHVHVAYFMNKIIIYLVLEHEGI